MPERTNFGPVLIAPVGSTGNNTHTSVTLPPAPRGIGVAPVHTGLYVVKFVVEAVGATPTVTWNIQGTNDLASVADGSATWADAIYDNTSDAIATPVSATKVVTAVGTTTIYFASNNHVLRNQYHRIRLVTSANTNVTYRGELYVELDY